MTINPDDLARLEDERRFLLRSITDLDREFEAGDLDEVDYHTVRDGYTARAAAVMRSLDEGAARLPQRKPIRRGRAAAWIVGVVVIAALSGWLMARASGQRLSGQTLTGGQPVDEITTKLTEARAALGTDPSKAVGLYQEIITLDPKNAEARTYTAWLLALSSTNVSPDAASLALKQATKLFTEVTTDTPDYADAHCLFAVTAGRWYNTPDPALASAQGKLCLANNPPAGMRGMIQQFVDNLGGGTSSSVAPTSTP